jgi:two-component system LytT family sensor kinase
MKKLLIILLLMACCLGAWAQTLKRTDKKLDLELTGARYPNKNANILLAFDSTTKYPRASYTSFYNATDHYFFLEDAKTIGIYLHVQKSIVPFYRYSVINEQGHTLINNKRLSFAPGDAIKSTNYYQLKLGRFNIDQKSLKVKYYNIKKPDSATSITIYNKPVKPAKITSTFVMAFDGGRVRAYPLKSWPNGFATHSSDNIEPLDVRGVLLTIQNTDINFIYHIYIKNLETGKSVRVGNNWTFLYAKRDPYAFIDVAYFQQPGKYEVSIIPSDFSRNTMQWTLPKRATKINFTVLEPAKTYPLKQLLLWLGSAILAIVLIAAAIIAWLKRRNTKRITKEKNHKLQAQMQLNAVRAQLNPHFIFNALAGIQNLMNRQETDQANRYLARFARLTRSVLDSQDFITVADELALLTDYLEMEKLRFGFTYTINTDPQLDAANVEIPAMLLQPLIENAVKHGVSGLGADGMITLDMQKQNDNILISVADNGQGFDSTWPTEGLGLKLTRDRIKLLNELHPDTPISLEIATPVQRALITITLNHWL